MSETLEYKGQVLAVASCIEYLFFLNKASCSEYLYLKNSEQINAGRKVQEMLQVYQHPLTNFIK